MPAQITNPRVENADTLRLRPRTSNKGLWNTAASIVPVTVSDLDSLGTFYAEDGTKYEAVYSKSLDEIGFSKLPNASKKMKYSDFMARGQHEGHSVIRIGTCAGPKRLCEIYFCQKDKTLFVDTAIIY